ncbi:threonine synthase [Methanococcus aeolicus]|uniref:Threonine synthase n=1 Tax=Methanococcus aeolicus (strain ATCC BAA-1280 / DSM 17508 / OCM 812 / Nankai-3) TaxID=419665 RepID=A6UTW1_META3|nr:threonine synthase [Methanococcus aeolicus]ABR55933.1 threonine synthase [Methanococcus aeolicus Nankai-3]UXM85468.1 threonine synthase [Methanococcus aeolicus]
MIQKCIVCGKEYDIDEIIYTCECGSLLEIIYDYEAIKENISKEELRKRRIGVWRYLEYLPVKDPKKIVSLWEGGTPLYKCDNLAKKLGLKELYVKNEGANPTGSFKDRGMTMGTTRANELGVEIIGCASTGNTSASLAAYTAKSNKKCIVLLPSGNVALGKLAQAMFYGAKVIQINGNFDDAMDMVKELALQGKIYLLNSINPFRLEGQKTIGFEICDQLDWEVPDRVILPVGNAGNISAIWKGFKEFKETGIIDKLPKMTGIQAEGAKPIVEAFKKGVKEIIPEEHPETIATAIRIGNPVNYTKAMDAIYSSNGFADSVNDEEITKAQKLLAQTEGIFVEPASAASIAGLIKLIETGVIDKNEKIVCITTGNGLKDPDAAIRVSDKPIEIECDMDILNDVINE